MIGQSMAVDFYWDSEYTSYEQEQRSFDKVLPQDFGTAEQILYIPAGTEQGYWCLAVEMRGVEQSYGIQGLWNDQGVHKILYDNDGDYTEEEFIRRFGKGAAGARSIMLAEGQELAVTADTRCISEPAGFQSYQWYGGSSRDSRESLTGSTENTLVPELSPGETKYYRCEAQLLTESFSLGEEFAATRKQLPQAMGIRMEVQT